MIVLKNSEFNSMKPKSIYSSRKCLELEDQKIQISISKSKTPHDPFKKPQPMRPEQEYN